MISKVTKYLIPGWLKKKMAEHYFTAMKNTRIQIDKNIPRVKLTERHINNCELILNRSVLLSKLKKNAVVAEIGVDSGNFSRQILDETDPQTLHLIDIWGNERYNDEKYSNVKNRFTDQINNNKIKIHRNLSTEATDKFPDNYFDWIYIDTDHTYETTKQELLQFAPKMKPGGIIAGHDYSMGHWIGSVRYGVIEATHEFCVNHDWELIYVTAEPIETQSFAIKKIND